MTRVDIEKLDHLEKLANFVSANPAEKVPTHLVHLLASNLASFVYEVLRLHPSDEPLQANMVGGFQDIGSADAAAVVGRLRASTGSSALTAGTARHELFDQVKLLLRRFRQVVRSMHEPRELSEGGWQWSDFNAGWDIGLRNSEYELPMVWRALRSSNEEWVPPSDPAGSGVHSDFITYWYSLSAVVLGHLAWANPALGMTRWINSGMPGDGGVLTGLKRLYGVDAAAVILNAHVTYVANEMAARTVDRGGESSGTFDPSLFLLEHPDIQQTVDNNRRWRAMSHEGTDSLHLSEHLRTHLLGPGLQTPRLAGGRDATSSKHAHLLLADGGGWYEALHLSAGQLSARADGRSWRVDVTSEALGYLGEFRKSRVTDRWFAGKHSSHMLGN